jgi:phosphoenolpyruvate phosphomutase
MKKTRQLKKILTSPRLEFLCEAHNGLSARIVEEAGFKGIWGSGLSISAQLGVRDSNEASWTQVLDVVEFMADATTIPILLDGDTGYGNFNNMRRLVRKLEQRGVAGVCIEDKLFPKTNSFLRGTTQPLADMEEFAGRIKAGKDAQIDGDFCIIARVEAFIAGWGLAEALRRAETYQKAGADGILIHSALSVPDEVLAFKKEWGDRLPVVIVPTKYYSTPTEVFRQYGFSVAIWANHVLRAAITGMQRVAGTIVKAESLMGVEDSVASVAEIFRLQGEKELEEAERRYLPERGAGIQAIVLAAARGKELGELTARRPKAMVEIAGEPLLEHIVDGYNAVGIKDITVVRGYHKETVDLPGLRLVDNNEYETTGEVYSLSKALQAMDSGEKDTVISYGDVLFKRYILEMLLESDDAFTVAVDTAWQQSVNRSRHADYVQCTLPYSREVFGQKVYLQAVVYKRTGDRVHGEWMGFLKVGQGSCSVLRETVDKLLAEPGGGSAKIPDLINALIEKGHQVRVLYTTGNWLDIDSLDDLVVAGSFQ